jgi:hypothetical protein
MVDIMGTAEANELKIKLVDAADPIVRALDMHWEQQKKK